jgi:hypothetical protein
MLERLALCGGSMTRRLAFTLALLLGACVPAPAPVPPPQPDADAAPDPAPVPEAAPAPMVPCEAACAVMARLCGPQGPDCVRSQAHLESAHEIRMSNGQPQTCVAVAAAMSVADMRAAGVHCP